MTKQDYAIFVIFAACVAFAAMNIDSLLIN